MCELVHTCARGRAANSKKSRCKHTPLDALSWIPNDLNTSGTGLNTSGHRAMPPLSLYSLGRTGIARLLLGSADQFYAKGISSTTHVFSYFCFLESATSAARRCGPPPEVPWSGHPRCLPVREPGPRPADVLGPEQECREDLEVLDIMYDKRDKIFAATLGLIDKVRSSRS